MDTLAIWSTMEAKPGREADVHAWLAEANRRIAADEPGTTTSTVMDLGEGKFAIFNTFVDEAALKAHVEGPVADWVRATARDLLAGPFTLTRAGVFGVKGAGTPA